MLNAEGQVLLCLFEIKYSKSGIKSSTIQKPKSRPQFNIMKGRKVMVFCVEIVESALPLDRVLMNTQCSCNLLLVHEGIKAQLRIKSVFGVAFVF